MILKSLKFERRLREKGLNMESGIDVVFDFSEEASEGVVAIGIELPLFLDVILLVSLAYLVDSEENVDHAHSFFLLLLIEDCFGGEKGKERKGKRGKMREERKRLCLFLTLCSCLSLFLYWWLVRTNEA